MLKYGALVYPVKYIENNQVVISIDGKIETVDINSLHPTKLSEKEEAFKEFMDAWKMQGIDYAFDGVNSIHRLDDVFSIAYQVLVEEKCE